VGRSGLLSRSEAGRLARSASRPALSLVLSQASTRAHEPVQSPGPGRARRCPHRRGTWLPGFAPLPELGSPRRFHTASVRGAAAAFRGRPRVIRQQPLIRVVVGSGVAGPGPAPPRSHDLIIRQRHRQSPRTPVGRGAHPRTAGCPGPAQAVPWGGIHTRSCRRRHRFSFGDRSGTAATSRVPTRTAGWCSRGADRCGMWVVCLSVSGLRE